jgi:hypothetical protein
VVIDANLWLSEFSRLPAEEESWTLPPLPAGVLPTGVLPTGVLPASIETNTEPSTGQYAIRRTVQMRQSRDMRSNEFHYLDHPALGLVISVMPYDLPAPAENLPADTLPSADIGLPPGPQDF